jgi:hypothetical protein
MEFERNNARFTKVPLLTWNLSLSPFTFPSQRPKRLGFYSHRFNSGLINLILEHDAARDIS